MTVAVSALYPVESEASTPALTFAGVGKTFAPAAGGIAIAALKGVDLRLERGAILGVVGASGAGKSTLLDLACGRVAPSAGRITVHGADLGARSQPHRTPLGFVPQEIDLRGTRTIIENILLAAEGGPLPLWQITLRARELLARLGLAHAETRFPRELSAGERQRAAIARALVTEPDLLLLDEPISALDRESAAAILAAIDATRHERGVTVLIASRNPVSLKDIADEIAVLDNGALVEQGPTYDLLTRPQSSAARALIGSAFSAALPAFLAEKLVPEPSLDGQAIVRLVFTGGAATSPVITRLARDLGLDANILLGSAETVRERLYGMLIVGVASGEPYLSAALAHFQDAGLETEVLGYLT